ncbi:MAG TPA: YdeI/OmpD-associated family protein [Kofleriaceae bacterium]|nr:YdeI/OmpD-associated family protein [Kofleriaceae bacterium]
MTAARPPRSFASPAALRAWFARHGATAGELVMRVWKVHAAVHGVTNRQAVDEALCHGWIDGVRHSIDDRSFRVRFTPRRPRSIWSASNIRRIGELEAEGRVTDAGRAAFAARSEARSRVYSFEQARSRELDAADLDRLRADEGAWAFWQARPPWYRRTSAHWVQSAKQPATRARRFETLLDCCRRRAAIPPLRDRLGGKAAAAAAAAAVTAGPRPAGGRGRPR